MNIGHWQVRQVPGELTFTRPRDTNIGWTMLAFVAIAWIVGLRQFPPSLASDAFLGLLWGLALLTILLVAYGFNGRTSRVTPAEVSIRSRPVPFLFKPEHRRRADVEAVHHWLHPLPYRRNTIERPIRPSWCAGVHLRSGKDLPLVHGLATEEEAARAAALIGEVLGLEPTRQSSPDEPGGTRVILFVVALLAAPLVGRIAGFVVALFQDW